MPNLYPESGHFSPPPLSPHPIWSGLLKYSFQLVCLLWPLPYLHSLCLLEGPLKMKVRSRHTAAENPPMASQTLGVKCSPAVFWVRRQSPPSPHFIPSLTFSSTILASSHSTETIQDSMPLPLGMCPLHSHKLPLTSLSPFFSNGTQWYFLWTSKIKSRVPLFPWQFLFPFLPLFLSITLTSFKFTYLICLACLP